MRAFLRLIIAIIFIASGFVKAVDVRGFSFKLEEYFSPGVFNMPFLESLALPLAIFVVALEIILGLLLLFKIRLRSTLLALIALCVFFGFLTFYSAYFDKVTDCGCFGDAIKFTPWQSFIKDLVILLALLILYWLFKRSGFEQQKITGKFSWIGLFLLSLIFFGIMIYGLKQEPMIDFRDYKIGTDMNAERRKIEQNPSDYKTFYILKNKDTGAEKKVDQDAYVNDKALWEEGTPWEIQSDKTTSELVKQGYQSEIIKFRIEDSQGNDVAAQILAAPEAVLLFSYEPAKLSAEELSKAEKSVAGNRNVYGISTAKGTFKTIPNLTMDKTAMKTIARSNPFVVVLKNGKIVDKYPAKNYYN